MLLWFLFPESPETALQAASPRLLLWCRAYQDWLAERRLNRPSTVVPANTAWRLLLQHLKKMPWDITPPDLQACAAWMASRGYSPATTGAYLRLASDFYRWCTHNLEDPLCRSGFNPTLHITRPNPPRFKDKPLLSRLEVDNLLAYMQQDLSVLGRRDYAFILARLRLGVPLTSLLKLRWGQVELDTVSGSTAAASSAWVRWRPASPRCPLPDDAWQAIRSSLRFAGRLPTIQPQDYVFAPLADPLKVDAGLVAGDWQSGRPLTSTALLKSLKRYGSRLGLPSEKLNLHTLRRTAIRLRLDQGATLQDMHPFLDSYAGDNLVRFRLKELPQLPSPEPPSAHQQVDPPDFPSRASHKIKPGQGLLHGLYARTLPDPVIAAIVAEGDQGIADELVGLRTLGRGLLEFQGEARSPQELAALAQAYTLLSSRLASMVRSEKDLGPCDEDKRQAEEFLDRMDKMMVDAGDPMPEGWRDQVLYGDALLGLSSRQFAEEIAGMRFVTRKAFWLALDAEDAHTYLNLVEVYGRACITLVKLLRSGGGYTARVHAYLQGSLETVLEEFALQLSSAPEN